MTSAKNTEDEKWTNLGKELSATEEWNNQAERWDTIIFNRNVSNFYNYKTMNFLITDYLDKSRLILDVGCGTGESFLPLIEKTEELIGIDVSLKMIEIAKGKNHNLKKLAKISLALCDCESLPFRNEVFDALSSRGTILSYVKDPLIALKEMRRVLKCNGKMCMDVLNKDFYADRGVVWRLYRLSGKDLTFEKEQTVGDFLVRVRKTIRKNRDAFRRIQRNLEESEVRYTNEEPNEEDIIESRFYRARMFTYDKLAELFKAAGLLTVEVTPLGALPWIIRQMGDLQFCNEIFENVDKFCRLEFEYSRYFDKKKTPLLFVKIRRTN